MILGIQYTTCVQIGMQHSGINEKICQNLSFIPKKYFWPNSGCTGHSFARSLFTCNKNRTPFMLGLTKSVGCRFEDATRQEFEYNDRGESNRGYHIYTITKSQGGSLNYYYDNVS